MGSSHSRAPRHRLTAAQLRAIQQRKEKTMQMGAMQAALRCFGVHRDACRGECTWVEMLQHCTSREGAVDAIKKMTGMCKRADLTGAETAQFNDVLGRMLAVLGENPASMPSLLQRCREITRITTLIAENTRAITGRSDIDSLIDIVCKRCPKACRDGGRERALRSVKLVIAASLLPHANHRQLRRQYLRLMLGHGFACKPSVMKQLLKIVTFVAAGAIAYVAAQEYAKMSTGVAIVRPPPMTIHAPPVVVPDGAPETAIEPTLIRIADMVVTATSPIAEVHGMPTDYIGVMDNKKPHQPRVGIFNVHDGEIRALHTDAELSAAKDLEAVAPVPGEVPNTYFFMSSKGVLYEGRVDVKEMSVATVSTIVLPKLADYHNIEAFNVMPHGDGLRVDYYQRGGQSAGFAAVTPTSGAALITRDGADGWNVTAVEERGVVHAPNEVMRAVTDYSEGWMASATDVEELEPGEAAGVGLPEDHDTSLIWPVNGDGVPVRVDGAKVEGLWSTGHGMDVVTDDEDRGTLLIRIVHGLCAGVRQLTGAREQGMSGIAPIHL